MKYIFFIIVAFLLVQEIPAQIRLNTMDSVTTFTPTDLFWLNTKPSSAFVNRKVSWRSLRSNIEDFMVDSAHTWAGIQTFNGATFNSGSHGKVLFNGDSVVITTSLWAHWLQRYAASSIIGNYNAPFFNVYAKTFTVINADETDSASISISSTGKVAITDLLITESVSIDSGATIGMFRLDPLTYNIPDVADTILEIPSASAKSFIILNPPGNVTNLNKFTLEGATIGTIVKIINADAFDTIALKDIVGNDDNLLLSADFTLGFYDSLDLLCVDDSPDAQIWIETARSNN